MNHKLRRKIKELLDQASIDMLDVTREAAVASGRYAALTAFLNGMTPEEAEQGFEILPPDWPQRQGWREMIDQFKLVYEIAAPGKCRLPAVGTIETKHCRKGEIYERNQGL